MKYASMLTGLPKIAFDSDAFTISELMDKTGMGEVTIRRIAHAKIASGEWEVVRKKKGRSELAYRPKQK